MQSFERGITFVCWLWDDPRSKNHYDVEHIRRLRSMLARHVSIPHELVCISDRRLLIEGVRTHSLWPDLAKYGRCYRRLKIFKKETAHRIATYYRLCSIDLDIVILDDITDLFIRSAPLVLLRDYISDYGRLQAYYNGSMFMFTPSDHLERNLWREWREFADNPDYWIDLARRKNFCGSDQAYLSLALGKDYPVWTKHDGVYSYRWHVKDDGLPNDARVVVFHGPFDMHDMARRYSWVKDNWK